MVGRARTKTTKTIDDFCHDMAFRESSGNPSAINQFGFLGLYQFGEAALVDLGYVRKKPRYVDNFDNKYTATDWSGKDGINSIQDFLRQPGTQTKAFKEMIAIRLKRLKRMELDKFDGKTKNDVLITLSGLVAGAHLVGEGGLQDWLKEGRAIKDGNGIDVQSYVKQFGGYAVC